jgi:hypothetical protein
LMTFCCDLITRLPFFAFSIRRIRVSSIWFILLFSACSSCCWLECPIGFPWFRRSWSGSWWQLFLFGCLYVVRYQHISSSRSSRTFFQIHGLLIFHLCIHTHKSGHSLITLYYCWYFMSRIIEPKRSWPSRLCFDQFQSCRNTLASYWQGQGEIGGEVIRRLKYWLK